MALIMISGELGTSDIDSCFGIHLESPLPSISLVRGIHCQQHVGCASGDLCKVISV